MYYHYWLLLDSTLSLRSPRQQQYVALGRSRETDNRQTMWGVIPLNNGLKQEHCYWTETVDLRHPAMEGSAAKKVSCFLLPLLMSGEWQVIVWSGGHLSQALSGCKCNLNELTVRVFTEFYMSNRVSISLHIMYIMDKNNTLLVGQSIYSVIESDVQKCFSALKHETASVQFDIIHKGALEYSSHQTDMVGNQHKCKITASIMLYSVVLIVK